MGRKKVQVEWNGDGTEKRCETCMHFYPPEEFHYKTKCEGCYQKYQEEYREKNREILAERKRLQRQARRANKEKSKQQLKRELTEKLTTALDDGDCRFCQEFENVCLRFLAAGSPNELYQLEDAISSFGEKQSFDLICLNCLAKQKHLLPQF